MQIGELFTAAVLIILLILLSPILVPLIIYTIIRDWINDRRFESFLRANDGAKYFCYTARKTSCEYVKENVLPQLPPGTRVIYLSDRRNAIDSLDDEIPFFDHIVWRMKKTSGSYPYVSKVSKGDLITISINQKLYSAIKRNADAEVINNKIKRFLDGEADALPSSSI